jgi:RNA polymerase sigma-70 factor (ECF subfamily)
VVDEERLIRRLKQRDDAAFSELVLRYQGSIYNLCYRVLGNAAEAEDVAQDVFVNCLRGIHAFRGDAALGTWLYRIAVNLCRNRLKYLGRRQYNTTQALDDVPEGAWTSARSTGVVMAEAIAEPDRALEGQRAESSVREALATLDPEFRELLVLRDVEGMSYADVVRVTGLAEGTVKSRLHRARAALRRAFEALETSR